MQATKKPTKRERFAPHAARIQDRVYGGRDVENPIWVVKQFLANQHVRCKPVNIDCDPNKGIWKYRKLNWTLRSERWSDKERAALRAKHDPVYRRSWNQKSLRWIKAWKAKHTGLDAYWGKDDGALKEAFRLRELAGFPVKKNLVIPEVHLLGIDYRTAAKLKVSVCTRGKDWSVSAHAERSVSHEHQAGETIWKNRVPKSYTRATNDTLIPSVATILDSQSIDILIYRIRETVTLPAGVRWAVDNLGLHVKCGPYDFHPQASDFLTDAGKFNEGCVDRFLNKVLDAAWIAHTPIEGVRMPLDEVYVCLRDSTAAGNCPAGSRTWAQQHAIDPRKHVRADVLNRWAVSDDRVKRAIVAASTRCQTDLQRGYSILSEHAL